MATTVPYVPNPAWADGSGGGTPITAAKLNTLEQGLTDSHQMPSVRVTHNTTQSIANSTDSALAFNTERFDTAGGTASTMHDTAVNNSRLTCRYAGKYQITGNLQFSSSTAGTSRLLKIRVNGTTVIAETKAVNITFAEILITTLWDLAVNDYVELIAFQDTGAAMTLTNVSAFSPEFMMVRSA